MASLFQETPPHPPLILRRIAPRRSTPANPTPLHPNPLKPHPNPPKPHPPQPTLLCSTLSYPILPYPTLPYPTPPMTHTYIIWLKISMPTCSPDYRPTIPHIQNRLYSVVSALYPYNMDGENEQSAFR